MNLEARAWVGLVAVAVIMGLVVFVAAGTIRYWQAWIHLSIFFGAAVLTTRYVARHDPALLARRLKGGPTAETRPVERVIVLGASLCFIALLVVPALDHRYGWSSVPLSGVIVGNLLFAVGFYFIFLVYRENTFASATIEVAKDQRVISTGPYAIVRHPMYASALLYLTGMPLALGSYWGLLPLGALLPLLVWRLVDEERLLSAELPGYRDYQRQVAYRLVPRIW